MQQPQKNLILFYHKIKQDYLLKLQLVNPIKKFTGFVLVLN